MDLLKKFDELNNRLSTLLEENKELKSQNKNLQEENHVLKEKLNERDYENLQEENKKLKQHVLNLENQKNDQLQKYKNLQEENKSLNMRETQFQQHIQNLEKQKSEQFEIFSQNLEKALGKLRLDELHEDNVNNPQKDFILSSDESDEDNVSNPKKDFSIEYYKDPAAKETTMKRSPSKKKPIPTIDKSSFNKDNIRVVVGLDFGTTYSGFSYCHVADSENIITNTQWPGTTGNLKTNTVLQYDYEYDKVESWGLPALAKRPSRRKNENRRPVELFKLHLGNLSRNLKPHLPNGLDYKKAITDYLHEIGKLIKETIGVRFEGIDFHKHVLLVLTVPTDYSDNKKAIMRECAFYAGLLENKYSANLQFITESEAAAIYCMRNSLKVHDLLTSGTTVMIVDCGGGTVDLTIHKLIGNNQLSEVTEGTGDFCGSTFIDNEFIKFLRNKLGNSAIDLLVTNNYGQFQYMIQEFCRLVKLPFTGDDLDFSYELDIEYTAPVLLQYVNEDIMEENDGLIKINYEYIKAMFDPIVDRIIKLIHLQLSNARKECSLMFLVGGFSESKYLQKRIKQEFQHRVKNISVPTGPIAATSHGAVIYGSSLKNSENIIMKINPIVYSKVLKYTYGIKVRNYWMEGDPIERKLRNGRIDRFHCIAKRGIQVNTNKKFTTYFTPLSPMQRKVSFGIYYTTEYDAKYCDEPGMEILGKISVYLADSGESSKAGILDKLFFAFIFGELGMRFIARNETNGQNYKTTFEIDI